MAIVQRVNLFDLGAAVMLASLAAAGVAGYRRFQVVSPEIVSVVPPRVAAGSGRTVSVHGRYLQPYLKVFVSAAGEAPVMTAFDPSKGEARVTATTATQLDIALPPVRSGRYDLYLFNEFQRVAFVPGAFEAAAPEYPRAQMAATVRFFLDSGPNAPVAVGERDRSTPADPDAPPTDGAVVTAVRVDPVEHPSVEMRLGSAAPGEGTVWLGSRAAYRRIDLDLRVPLARDAAGEWLYHGATIRAGQSFAMETARLNTRGTVITVGDPEPQDGQGARR